MINEIINPISGDDNDEYVELHNRSANTLDLAGWRFTDGIDFEFSAKATLAPGLTWWSPEHTASAGELPAA